MRTLHAGLLLAIALGAPTALADVVLFGSQHIGDDESAAFTPSDPVEGDQFLNSASRFHLTQGIEVTAIRLEGFVGANQPIAVELDGSNRANTHVNGLITLAQPRSLSPGAHTIALDPGCLRGGVHSFNCRRPDDEFDIGFSAITLITASATQLTFSRNLNRRRHLGDTTDFQNNNFGDRYYPDAPEGAVIDVPFTLDRNLRLSEVRFYRLRDVAAGGEALSRARVSIVDTTTAQVVAVGSLTGNGNPFILPTSLSLAAGSYAVRVEAGQMRNPTSDQDKGLDDVRWNDILLLFAADVSASPGEFNAIDPLEHPVTGVVRSKIAGSPLGVDIAAIGGGQLVTSYVGDVVVDLLDASDDSGALDAFGCRSSWAVRENLGVVAFTLADGGRRQNVQIEVADAYPHARLRMVDQVLQVGGCSTDAFAVRPQTFALAVTDGDWETPGTARTLNNLDAGVASPIHKAGRPFTIRATALNADGAVTPRYSGSPTVLALSSVLGATKGEARGEPWTATGGVVQTDDARYTEAGAFMLEVKDTTFAAIDVADTSPDARTVGPATTAVGRFVPDHFEVSVPLAPAFAPGCGTFTYSGQPFNFAPGLEPVITLTAVANGGAITTNYTGDLFKFPSPLAGVSAYTALGHALEVLGLSDPDASVMDMGGGVVRLALSAPASGVRFVRPAAPEAPFDAEIEITRAVEDSEGVRTQTHPMRIGEAVAGNGIAFSGGAAAKQVRFGRLALSSAHGSERLPLDVPLRTEYWGTVAGSTGFVQALADSCTTVAAGDVVAVPSPPALPVALTVGPVANGAGAITLDAPGMAGHVDLSVNLSAATLPWLRGDWDGNGTWDDDADDPTARATFGLHKGEERRIYQREVVGD